jgi:hypothetical protein
MTLEPAPKDLSRCCQKCTKKPFLDGCRQDYGCACHNGYKPSKPIQIIRDIHVCFRENCEVCQTNDPFSY